MLLRHVHRYLKFSLKHSAGPFLNTLVQRENLLCCTLFAVYGRHSIGNFILSGSDCLFVTPYLDLEPWAWIIDCEQVCGLLLGRCIYNHLTSGIIHYSEISKWKYWFQSELLSDALENKIGSLKDYQQTLLIGKQNFFIIRNNREV